MGHDDKILVKLTSCLCSLQHSVEMNYESVYDEISSRLSK